MKNNAAITQQLVSEAISNVSQNEVQGLYRKMQAGQLTHQQLTERLAKMSEESRKLFMSMGASWVTPEKMKKKIAEAQKKAARGDIESQLFLGDYYLQIKDIEQAIEWYKKVTNNKINDSATVNHFRGMAFFQLAQLSSSKGEKKKDREACDYYYQSFNLGIKNDLISQNLSQYYVVGFLVEDQITKELIEIWQRMANKATLGKMTEPHKYYLLHALAKLYAIGNANCNKDISLAKQYFLQLVEEVNSNEYKIKAMLALITFYKYEDVIVSKLVLPDEIYKISTQLAKLGEYGPLGQCYLFGIGTSKNPKLAFNCFEKKTTWSSWVKAYKLVCQLLEEGNWPISREQALEGLEKIAHRNNQVSFYAQKNLSYYFYKEGQIEKFIFWAKKVADRGCSETQFELGKFYYNKSSNFYNPDLAIHYFTLAAERNHPSALYRLGEFHAFGLLNYKKNTIKAIPYLDKAKEYGSVEAIFILGDVYLRGEGITANKPKAFNLLSQAASLNHSRGLQYLGYCYQRGEGCTQDHKKALECYKQAHSLGDEVASLRLARCYLLGIGCPKDKAEAFRLFSSLKSQYATCTLWLGYCYQYGWGTEVSDKKAFDLYNSVSSIKVEAHIMVIQYWYWGGPIPKDIERAIQEGTALLNKLQDYKAYNNQAEFSCTIEMFNEYKSICLYLLGNCHFSKKDFVAAFGYYQEARKLDNTLALDMVVFCYENGIGVEQDHEQAVLLQKINNNNQREEDPGIDFQAWKTQKQHNENLVAKFLAFPHQFTKLLDKSDNNLCNLKQNLHDLETHFNKLCPNNKKLFETAKVECDQAFAAIEGLCNTFMQKYDVYKNQITAVLNTHYESIERFINDLQQDLISCEKHLHAIKNQINLLQEQLEKIKIASKSINSLQPDNSKIRMAAIPAVNELNAIANEELLQKKKIEEYNTKREIERQKWIAATKKYHEELLGKQKAEKDSKLSAEANEKVSYILAKHCKQRNTGPSLRILADDWQVPLQVRFKEETDTLSYITAQFSSFEYQENNLKPDLTLDDLWIQRELLINLLGRLMELAKSFVGKEKRLPSGAAAGIRNLLLKHHYQLLGAVPEKCSTKKEVMKIKSINIVLRLAVKKVINFFKIHSALPNATNSWEEVYPLINSPFLDDLITKSGLPTFSKSMWSKQECLELVTRENSNLQRLKNYNGIYQRQDICRIVKECCIARLGSISSYVIANHSNLNVTPEEYQFLVRKELIKKGNAFRHSEKTLLFQRDEKRVVGKDQRPPTPPGSGSAAQVTEINSADSNLNHSISRAEVPVATDQKNRSKKKP